jgi:hypothetical protein
LFDSGALRVAGIPLNVVAGLVPAIHTRDPARGLWIAGTNPAMTIF